MNGSDFSLLNPRRTQTCAVCTVYTSIVVPIAFLKNVRPPKKTFFFLVAQNRKDVGWRVKTTCDFHKHTSSAMEFTYANYPASSLTILRMDLSQKNKKGSESSRSIVELTHKVLPLSQRHQLKSSYWQIREYEEVINWSNHFQYRGRFFQPYGSCNYI